MSELSVFPSDREDWVELSRSKQGRIFEKHILNKGKLIHPANGSEIDINDEFVKQLKLNFDNNVCDIVQVPLAGPKNEHSEDPDRNIGEVVGIRERDGKVYAIIDARSEGAADKLGKTYLGASAMLHPNYVDTRTGKPVGPTLLHVAVTNRPYVLGLDDYKEVVAASNSSDDDIVVYDTKPVESVTAHNPPQTRAEESIAAALSNVKNTTVEENADDKTDKTLNAASEPIEEKKMTLSRDELLAALKNEHGVDVAALEAAASQANDATALSNKLADSLGELLKDSGTVALSATEEITDDVIVGAIAELANTNKSLTTSVRNLERVQAEYVVRNLVEEGRVLPAQQDAMVELRLTSPSMFDRLVPDAPVVKVDGKEVGVTTPDTASLSQEKNVDDELARLSQMLEKGLGKKVLKG
jgi:hypothetical protein